jgi:hypothetical protein
VRRVNEASLKKRDGAMIIGHKYSSAYNLSKVCSCPDSEGDKL